MVKDMVDTCKALLEILAHTHKHAEVVVKNII